MRKFWTPLLLFGLLAAPALAQENVAKVVEIKEVKPGASKLNYSRDGKGPWAAFVNMDGKTKDVFITDANTAAALELDLGGRIAIKQNSQIEIVSERSVKDASKNVKKLKVTKGGVWAKCGQMREPLEIQTTGGVMGIKGTEFVVDTTSGGNTTVSLLEGSIEVTDPGGKPIGTMKPGDQWTLAVAQAPVQKNYQPDSLRKNIEDSSDWRDAMTAVSYISGWVPGGVPYAGTAVFAAANLATVDFENDPWGSAQKILNAANSIPGVSIPGTGYLPGGMWGGGGSSAKREPDFITNLTPDNSQQGQPPSAPTPTFSWKPIDGAHAYAVLVSPNEQMAQGTWEWYTTTKAATAPYAGKPLIPGRHYWRVVPLDEENKPLEDKKGSQTYFEVK